MKVTVILAAACVFLFLSTGMPEADELQDLKDQLEQLQKKIEELEKKQAEQTKEVEQIKEQPSAYEVVTEELGKQAVVGGHFKFFLGDQSIGEVQGDNQHNSFSAGINDLWLYFGKNLTDWLQITVAPQIKVEAAATPVLGADINRSGSADVDIDLDWAYMTLRLPWELELKAGAFFPYFSEEYASKVWWDQQYHGNPGLLNLQVWKSAGIELYRNFDFEHFSLPVYFYPFLNGEDRNVSQDKRFTDNNSAKSALLHVAPEFFAFGSRIRLLGSGAYGRWDNDGEEDSYQWAAGADLTWRGFNLSGEYMYRWRENLPLTGGGRTDDEDKGWYVKGLYTFNPQWRVMLKYSDVDLWQPSTNRMLTDNYKTWSAGINYFITESSIIMPQFQYVDADRSGGTEDLDYWRYTMGWRTTF
jgi:hypothetical protein